MHWFDEGDIHWKESLENNKWFATEASLKQAILNKSDQEDFFKVWLHTKHLLKT
jgi:hypothetical protein